MRFAVSLGSVCRVLDSVRKSEGDKAMLGVKRISHFREELSNPSFWTGGL